jgi:hypothetical protein
MEEIVALLHALEVTDIRQSAAVLLRQTPEE